MSGQYSEERLSIFYRLKKVLYDLLRINDFKLFFNNFNTIILSLFLILLILSLFATSTLAQEPMSNPMVIITCFFTIGLWFILFVSDFLKKIVWSSKH